MVVLLVCQFLLQTSDLVLQVSLNSSQSLLLLASVCYCARQDCWSSTVMISLALVFFLHFLDRPVKVLLLALHLSIQPLNLSC